MTTPLAQLDLSTLWLWVDPALLAKGPHRESTQVALDHAIHGDMSGLVDHVEGLDDISAQSASVLAASAIWHEQRHFLDALLTNHCAAILRRSFAMYSKNWAVLEELLGSSAELTCPLDALADTLRRRAHGLREPTETELDAAAYVSNARQAVAFDRAQYAFPWGLTEVGGEAQLEAMAWLMQQKAVFDLFGSDAALRIERSHGDLGLMNQRYRWPMLLAQEVGLERLIPLGDGLAVGTGTAIPPLLFAALAGEQGPRKDRSSDAWHPAERLERILAHLKIEGAPLDFLPVSEVCDRVDHACDHIWGKSVAESLLDDHQRDLALLAMLRDVDRPPVLATAFSDYCELRRSLIQVFDNDPGTFVDLDRFTAETLPNLAPYTCVVSTDGMTDGPGSGLEANLRFDDGKSWWWWTATFTNWPGPRSISLKENSAWIGIADRHGPISKLVLNGRSHRVMLEVELVVTEHWLAEQGIRCRFLPRFEFPRLRSDPAVFWRVTQTGEASCDFCRRTITAPAGHIISPWLFRASPLLRELMEREFGGGEAGALRLKKDWSVWVVCDACLELLEAVVRHDRPALLETSDYW